MEINRSAVKQITHSLSLSPYVCHLLKSQHFPFLSKFHTFVTCLSILSRLLPFNANSIIFLQLLQWRHRDIVIPKILVYYGVLTKWIVHICFTLDSDYFRRTSLNSNNNVTTLKEIDVLLSAFFVKEYFPVCIFWFLIGGLSTVPVRHYVSS